MPVVKSYTEARANLASLFDRVTEDHQEVIITRQHRPNVVLLSQEDYESLRETAYLFRSPLNGARLQAAYDQAMRGEGEVLSSLGDLRRSLAVDQAAE